MPTQYVNQTGHGIDIPRFGIYAAAGATFTVPDEDNGSLADDPGIAAALGAAGFTLTDNGDGSYVVTASAVVDNGDGTFTISDPAAVNNGDGTYTLTA